MAFSEGGGDLVIKVSSSQFMDRINKYGGVVEWLTRRTSNLRISSRMGSNPVRDKPLFP